MKKHNIAIAFGISLAIGAFVVVAAYVQPILIRHGNAAPFDNSLRQVGAAAPSRNRKTSGNKPPISAPTTPARTAFADHFDAVYTVEEAGDMKESGNASWWVASGAYFFSAAGFGSTVKGPLKALDPWRAAFDLANPVDTGNGYYPQNIFRLVLKSLWQNYRQEAYFRILANNLTDSPNRNASNGLLFFNRYKDENTLYYTGIRVDGYAVIKKKINGTYHTMAYKALISGGECDRTKNPNLLPLNKWIGLRTEIKTNADGSVNITLFTDIGRTGNWTMAAEATDTGTNFAGGVISGAGYAGIRTDFMDVEFDDYSIETL